MGNDDASAFWPIAPPRSGHPICLASLPSRNGCAILLLSVKVTKCHCTLNGVMVKNVGW